MKTEDIIKKYIGFFEKRGHKRIENSPLVPQNDPTTLFTSSGMQSLVPYLLGKPHLLGKRLVNIQDCLRAQDIDEIGDNRHTTFFRMLGNWSLGDYFKKEQLPWFFEFLTKDLNLPVERLYISVFNGFNDIPKDRESEKIWKEIFESKGINPKERIFYYGFSKNWWSKSGSPQDMPEDEPGGPDSEVFFDFGTPHDNKYGEKCHINCDCGRYLEIGNSVFMQYQKKGGNFRELPQKNVDFGGGLERLLAAVENSPDIFKTSLFYPIIKTIEKATGKTYEEHALEMRIITDHLVASVSIAKEGILPSNKEQGYILRRLIRRTLDNFYRLSGKDIIPIIISIAQHYQTYGLKNKFEDIKNVILEEQVKYNSALNSAKKYVEKKYNRSKVGDELMGVTKISPEDAFVLYSTHGLSPTQIRSLGFDFNESGFAKKMKEHQNLSRKSAKKKFS